MDYCGSLVGEATGDSEADLDPYAAGRREAWPEFVEDNEEDAQSCVCDSRGVSCSNGSVLADEDEEGEDEGEDGTWDDDDDDDQCQMGFCENAVARPETVGNEEEEEEDGVVNEEVPKRNVLITEMEDRLFWETCF
ncbi:hypothetical protein H6P81_002046 [Aristolochia fimbriata]|uniref:Uncharacterized protein n=1 Tax=Aristolochia fimbriata TaxID=158543 RepID=A0AAV7F8W7_ARIFI|nr:hypothetical protein H6P81_002046 [Aristolochia fimbriata]